MTCPQNAGIKRNFRQLASSCQSQPKFSVADRILTSLKVLIPVISSVSEMLLHNHGRSCYYCEPTTALLLCRRFLSAFHLLFLFNPVCDLSFNVQTLELCQIVRVILHRQVMFFTTTVGNIMNDDLLPSSCSVLARVNQHLIKSREWRGLAVIFEVSTGLSWAVIAHLNERQVCI